MRFNIRNCRPGIYIYGIFFLLAAAQNACCICFFFFFCLFIAKFVVSCGFFSFIYFRVRCKNINNIVMFVGEQARRAPHNGHWQCVSVCLCKRNRPEWWRVSIVCTYRCLFSLACWSQRIELRWKVTLLITLSVVKGKEIRISTPVDGPLAFIPFTA